MGHKGRKKAVARVIVKVIDGAGEAGRKTSREGVIEKKRGSDG